ALQAAAAPNEVIPFAIDRQVIRSGQDYFDAICANCHGRLGNGDGMIVRRGFVQPPSFHVDRLKDAPDSHFYNVISNGYGAMFSQAIRVPPKQRWEVVAYIRALQAAPETAGAEFSQADRRALIAKGDRLSPAGGAKP